MTSLFEIYKYYFALLAFIQSKLCQEANLKNISNFKENHILTWKCDLSSLKGTLESHSKKRNSYHAFLLKPDPMLKNTLNVDLVSHICIFHPFLELGQQQYKTLSCYSWDCSAAWGVKSSSRVLCFQCMADAAARKHSGIFHQPKKMLNLLQFL